MAVPGYWCWMGPGLNPEGGIYVAEILHGSRDMTNFSIHGLIKFKVEGTNKRHLGYLNKDYACFKTNEPIEPDLDIVVSDFTPDNDDCYVVNHKYWVKEDYLFYTHRHKVVRWSVCLRDLDGKRTTVYFSGTKFSEVFLRDYIIEPLINLKLNSKGFSMLHASGIAVDKKGFIFPACKGVGKTSTLLNLIGRGTFIGNDKVILSSDGRVYSYPSFVHIFGYNLRDVPQAFESLTLKQRIDLKIKNCLSVLSGGYVTLPLDVNPQELWGKPCASYPLQSLILLTKTNRDNVKIAECHDKSQLIKRLAIINGYEMQHFQEILAAYSYVYPGSHESIEHYLASFQSNLAQALGKVLCYEVEVPSKYTADTYSSIDKLLK